MDCLDTISVIGSFLNKRDIVQLSHVSQLCLRATEAALPAAFRRFFVGPCFQEDSIDLVPPCQVVGLCFSEAERQLFVLAHVQSPLSRDNECCLFIQEAQADGYRSYQRVRLPREFARSGSHVKFAGQRFLYCSSLEGTITVFDCSLQTPLELPFGVDGFYVSPDGRRCVIDVDSHLFYCSCDESISEWWEMQPGKNRMDSLSHSSSVMPILRAKLSVERFLLRYPMGNSSSAWRMLWVGQMSVLYAHEDDVVLLRKPKEGAPSCDAVQLQALAGHSSALAHGSCCTVYSGTCGRDDYAILDCRSHVLRVVRSVPLPDSSATLECIYLNSILPPVAVIKEIHVVYPGEAYMIFMQHQQLDRVLFFSADLSLSRWINVGPPSTLTLLMKEGVLISAPLQPEDSHSHPLLETVEGGMGTVFSFSGDPYGDLYEHPVSVDIKPACIDCGDPYDHWLSRAFEFLIPQSFNGVETLSWLALGVVSASLVWTISALIYNGWWLHVQLLFWGKLPG